MRAIKLALLVALLVASTAVVIATPAFATPRLTSSTGRAPDNGASAPFITPIGNTRNLKTLTSRDVTLTIGTARVRCANSHISAYVDITHTQSRVVSLTIGNGAGSTCVATLGLNGTVDGDSITEPTTNSTTPSFLHYTTILGGTSDTGTFNLSGAITARATVALVSCTITVPAQSIRFTETWTNKTYVIDDRTVAATITGGGGFCPGNTTATLSGTFLERADTTRDGDLSSRTAS